MKKKKVQKNNDIKDKENINDNIHDLEYKRK